MNTELNNLDEPRLTPPEVVYEKKASLKKKAVVPLYVQIASAAAAVALVLTLSWPRPDRPAEELMAALKPLAAKWTVAGEGKIVSDEGKLFSDEGTLVAHVEKPDPVEQTVAVEQTEQAQKAQPNPVRPSRPATTLPTNREALPLLAAMPELTGPATVLTGTFEAGAVSSNFGTEDLAILPQSSLAELALAWTPESHLVDEMAESVLGRGLIKMTEGEYEGVGSILRQGWRSVKVELAQLNETVGTGFRQLKQIPPPPSLPIGRPLKGSYQ